jgi:hypothetical protein
LLYQLSYLPVRISLWRGRHSLASRCPCQQQAGIAGGRDQGQDALATAQIYQKKPDIARKLDYNFPKLGRINYV